MLARCPSEILCNFSATSYIDDTIVAEYVALIFCTVISLSEHYDTTLFKYILSLIRYAYNGCNRGLFSVLKSSHPLNERRNKLFQRNHEII